MEQVVVDLAPVKAAAEAAGQGSIVPLENMDHAETEAEPAVAAANAEAVAHAEAVAEVVAHVGAVAKAAAAANAVAVGLAAGGETVDNSAQFATAATAIDHGGMIEAAGKAEQAASALVLAVVPATAENAAQAVLVAVGADKSRTRASAPAKQKQETVLECAQVLERVPGCHPTALLVAS